MKAGIFFTGSGPIVVITSYDALSHSRLVEKLEAKGLKKFIAYEVPIAQVKEKYGQHFNVIMQDLKQDDDLRVLDYDGQRVFKRFSIKELGKPIVHEP